MRTVVWERKPRGSEAAGVAAERIRKRLEPKWRDRFIDPIADFGERLHALWESKTLTSAPPAAPWLYKLAPTLAVFALAFALFIFEGKVAMAPHFFGSIAVVLFGMRAYGDWHSQHPLPEIHLRSARHDLEPLFHGLAAGIVAFLELRIVTRTLEGPTLPVSLCLFASAVVALMFGQSRAAKPKAPEKRRTAIGILAGLATWAFFMWLSRLP